MVTGANAGIQHVFRLTTDAFAAGRDPALVNNKEYYYLCIAYAHNRYKEYSQTEADLLDGQKEPYLAGRKNEWGGTIEPVVAIPHDPIAENGGTIVQAEFGMCPNITRIEGYGNGGSILKLTQKSLEELMGKPGEPAKAPGTSVLDATTGSLTLSNPCIIENPVYEENYGPVNVKVIDPLNIKPGKFVIKFNGINDQSKWVITNAEAGKPLWVENYVYDADNNIIDSVCVYSDTADFVIGRYNEQLFLDLGVSVAITNPKAVASDFVITTTPSGIAYGDGGYVNIAGTQFDVAHVKWGGSWKMPSQDQNSELFEKCTYEWTTRNGVEGGKFTGPNGESIFLPAAGNRNNDHLSLVGLNGLYWSSTSSFSAYLARSLGFDSNSFGINYSNFRNNGFSVRPVCK